MAQNFFAPGFDQQTEQQNIERSRQYAELMRQQGQKAPEGRMAGRVYVPPSITEGLAQMLKSYQGGQGVREADDRQKALADAVRSRQTEEVGKFTRMLGGAPAQPTGETYQTGANEMGDEAATVPQWRGAQAADPAGAYQYAAGASTPGLQQAGMQGAMQMAQEQAKMQQAKAEQQRMLAVLQGAGSPQAAISAGVPPELVKNFYESPNFGAEKKATINGQLIGENTGKVYANVPKQSDAPNLASDLLIPDGKGGMIPNAPLIGAKKDIGRAGASNITQVAGAGPKAFETELGKLDAKQLGDYRTSAETANATLQTVQNMRQAISQGVYSGGGANAKAAAANLVNGLTGAMPTNLPGSQLFNAEASKLVLDHVKSLGANPSNADRDFIEKTVPMLNTSPQARDAMVNYIEKKAKQTMDTYQRADAHARKNSTLGGFNAFAPVAPGAATTDGWGIAPVK